MSSDDETPKTLSDNQIRTVRRTGRRGFLGLVTLGGAAGAVSVLGAGESQAQSTDIDNGNWTDRGGCGRGGGGLYTGITDADSGNITDAGGYGRGTPYC